MSDYLKEDIPILIPNCRLPIAKFNDDDDDAFSKSISNIIDVNVETAKQFAQRHKPPFR
jgi:hypothetical protein